MKSRPRILYLSPCSPNERASGGQLRVLGIGRALKKVGDVHFVVAGFDGSGELVAPQEGGEFEVDRFLPVEQMPPKTFTSRLRSAFNPYTVNTYGHQVDAGSAAWLFQHMAKFDLIWLYNLRTPSVFGRWSWPRSVMDIDDVPSTFFRTNWRNGDSAAERYRACFRMLMAKRRERLLSQRFTVLAVSSEADCRYLNSPGRVHIIPNGLETPHEEPLRNPANPPRIGFVGVFDYPPNKQGVEWFVRKCWPQIKRRVPQAQLRLVGYHTEGSFKSSGLDIHGLGHVENANAEIATWSLMIVPIHLGAGTRVKIALGFSRKCPVVSTSLGAHGYEVRNGEELFLADTSDNFVDACLRVINQPQEAAEVAERARKSFLEKWSWDAINPRVWAAAEDCLRRSVDQSGAEAVPA